MYDLEQYHPQIHLIIPYIFQFVKGMEKLRSILDKFFKYDIIEDGYVFGPAAKVCVETTTSDKEKRMQLDRCKSCGGELTRIGNYHVCSFCGNKWMIDADNDVHVIDRANAWSALRDCDFERACELFENILFKEPENHEAYWGRALANAGIIYVTDLNESKKVPTCNSISESSFLENRDTKKAIELAPEDIAEAYRKQAEQIESIRVEWVKKASREPAYDVFISYKDSDRENGIVRTEDSYDAHELYNVLTAEGYKVFFSRVSLSNKISERYEPYIYNAIKTAKVMIVFGEKPEYFNAVWVKNEWMRFRKRIELGEKHPSSLVVAYKGIDPADLPVGLRARQCLNAGSFTFLEELKGHIRKITQESRTASNNRERDSGNSTNNTAKTTYSAYAQAYKPRTKSKSSVNPWVLFWLCVFGGLWGVHHFAEKKIGKGLLHLFTAGLFYLGWIVDCFAYYKRAKYGIQPSDSDGDGDDPEVMSLKGLFKRWRAYKKSFWTKETTAAQKWVHFTGHILPMSFVVFLCTIGVIMSQFGENILLSIISFVAVLVWIVDIPMCIGACLARLIEKARHRRNGIIRTQSIYTRRWMKFLASPLFLVCVILFVVGALSNDSSLYPLIWVAIVLAIWAFMISLFAHCPRRCKMIRIGRKATVKKRRMITCIVGITLIILFLTVVYPILVPDMSMQPVYGVF